jgi:hypothetical protein
MSLQIQISVHIAAPAKAVAVVDAGLDSHNIASAPLVDVQLLHVIAQNRDGTVVGGAIGRTWGAEKMDTSRLNQSTCA